MSRPASPCIVAGCPGRAIEQGRCAVHARQRNRENHEKYPDTRPNMRERGYTAEWDKLRKRYLAKHRYCVMCEAEGHQTRATDVDHIISRRQGGTDDLSNLAALCHSHHSRKTARSDGGGWTASRPKA